MGGSGQIAEQIRRVFKVFAAQHHLDGELPPYNRELFRAPPAKAGQMRLF